MRKCGNKYLFFFVLFFLIFHSYELNGGIVIYDCDGRKLVPKESAVAKMHKKKAENVINEINSNNCLPKLWKDLINNFDKSDKYPIKIHLSCEENFDCGEGDIKSAGITIPKYYSDWESPCGCEESSILHEMLHALAQVSDNDDDHKKIRGCEVKCTANIGACKRNPPPGEACECPK
jgi:hypothetical protein